MSKRSERTKRYSVRADPSKVLNQTHIVKFKAFLFHIPRHGKINSKFTPLVDFPTISFHATVSLPILLVCISGNMKANQHVRRCESLQHDPCLRVSATVWPCLTENHIAYRLFDSIAMVAGLADDIISYIIIRKSY